MNIQHAFPGHVAEAFTVDALFAALSGTQGGSATNSASAVKKTYLANLPVRTLVGFFPDPTTKGEIIVVRYNSSARVVPGVTLRVENGEWRAFESPLAAGQLEHRPLVLVEGDVKFIRILLELVSVAMTSNRWQSQSHAEKWAIALRLSKWLREPKANWGRRAAELYRMLKRGPLMPNTLEQKVKRLLAWAD